MEVPRLPPGSERIGDWARRRGFSWSPVPALEWFRAWEPYDTMTSPESWFSSVSWPLRAGGVVVAEPWYAAPDAEPLARTMVIFVVHSGFRRRAAARSGEHFNTRVAYLENPPPPTVTLGDPTWDRHLTTFAASSSEAAAAFPLAARQLLARWGFAGHLEVRPGGLVVNFSLIQPAPEQLDGLPQSVPELVSAFMGE
ncbi:MAG: hypothetical protein OZ921_19720 [Sorangiineae bacterium]|nr:hypothetical protein [Polyangiaceae bacterium]MEB2324754.1 hypothetical protein [Sorangiineae bacterium]